MGAWLLGLLLMAWGGTEAWWASMASRTEPIGITELLDALWWLPVEGGHVDAEWPEGDDVSDTGPVLVDDLDSGGWVGLGLSPRQAASAIRYRNAVGGFRDRSVFERMRVLPQGWLERHSDRLVFSEPSSGLEKNPEEKPVPRQMRFNGEGGSPKRPSMAVDLNSADSLTLISIRGVGPWVTGRILGARRKWGGFSDTALLVEALGWDSLAQALMPLFVCEAPLVKVHCPDSLTVEGWSGLPGVRRDDAAGIVRYVRHHGGSMDTLRQCKVLDSIRWARLIPYLGCGARENP